MGEIPDGTPGIYVSEFEGDPNVKETLVGHNIQKHYLKCGHLVKFSHNAPEKETVSIVEPDASNTFETMMKAAANLPQYKKGMNTVPS